MYTLGNFPGPYTNWLVVYKKQITSLLERNLSIVVTVKVTTPNETQKSSMAKNIVLAILAPIPQTRVIVHNKNTCFLGGTLDHCSRSTMESP